MLSIQKIMSVSALAFVCAVVGCDQSKAELDATKGQLQTAPSETASRPSWLRPISKLLASSCKSPISPRS